MHMKQLVQYLTHMHAQLLSFIQLFLIPWTVAHQAPLSMGFPRQEYWSCCCGSVAHSCPTLCNPTDCSAPGFPVLHYLPEPAQTHIH